MIMISKFEELERIINSLSEYLAFWFLRADPEKEDYRTHISINTETPTEIHRGNAVCCPSHYLCTIWEVLSSMQRFGINERAIEFINILYYDPFNIPIEGENTLNLWIRQGCGNFEFHDDSSGPVLAGWYTIGQKEDKSKKKIKEEKEVIGIRKQMPENSVTLSADRVYSELASRGHTYKGNLMALTSIVISHNLWLAQVNHGGDMNLVLAAAFQLVQLQDNQARQICAYPRYIRNLYLDPKKFLTAYPEKAEIYYNVGTGQVTATGLTIIGLEFRPHQSDFTKDLKMQASALNFIPYGTRALHSAEDVVSLGLQLALDAQPTTELGVTVLELNNGLGQVHKTVGGSLRHLASAHHNIELNTIKMLSEKDTVPSKLPMGATTCGIILSGPSTLFAAASLVHSCPSAIILAHLKTSDTQILRELRHMKVLAEHVGASDRTVLLRALSPTPSRADVIMVQHDDPVPVPESINVYLGTVFVWTAMPTMGIRAVVDAITKMPGGGVVQMVFILDSHAPSFSTSHPLYRDQLALEMRINILEGGVWGSLKTLPLPFEAHNTPNGRDSLLSAVSTNSVEGTIISHWGIEHVSATKMRSELALDYCGEGPRGPVFGLAKAINGQPKLDPLLQWPVPQGWTSADAATVPTAYCQAYLALRRCIYQGMLSAKDNVLVTEPLHPGGEAAVRVALATGRFGQVFVLARDGKEENTIQTLFSDAPGVEKLRCMRPKRRALRDALLTKTILETRIGIIVTVNPENVRESIIDVVAQYGHFVCLGGAETATHQSFGTSNFAENMAIYFVSYQSVLHMREDDRQIVHAAIAEGLKPSGFVRPLRRVVRSNSSALDALWGDQDAMSSKVVLRVKQSESPIITFGTGSRCLIAGGTPQQTINLANWSAKRGIKHIVAVQSESQSAFFHRHTDLLQAAYGAKLHVFAELRSALKESLLNGSLALIFAIAYDTIGKGLALELAQFRSNVPLVIFGTNGSDHGVLADSCKTRHRNTPHSLLLVGQMDQPVSSRLMDWLLQNERPPVITLLRCAAESRAQKIPAARLLKLLPQGAESLATLGTSFVPSGQSPRLIEIPTNGPNSNYAREVYPLFVVPGLSASIDTIIKPLAENLLVPLIYVRLSDKMHSVVSVAKEIAKLIQRHQPDGPYNLLGFDWTAALTQQIAEEIRNNNNHVTMFLLDGEPGDVNEVNLLSQRQDFECLLLSSCLNLQINSSIYAEVCALPSWSHRIRHLESMFREESAAEVKHALNVIRGWVDALVKHKVSKCHADVHLIQSSAPADDVYVKTKNLHVMRCIESHEALLTTPQLKTYINDHTGYPCLQTTDACIKRVKYS